MQNNKLSPSEALRQLLEKALALAPSSTSTNSTDIQLYERYKTDMATESNSLAQEHRLKGSIEEKLEYQRRKAELWKKAKIETAREIEQDKQVVKERVRRYRAESEGRSGRFESSHDEIFVSDFLGWS